MHADGSCAHFIQWKVLTSMEKKKHNLWSDLKYLQQSLVFIRTATFV